MAMQKLPCDIQSLFCASTQICSYKRAVEELVYNSLDAESTSIAIRVNIEQNTIQVIDNGCGVTTSNFSLIGHRHATSKCVDLSTLKSVSNKYGYRGQSLASLIEVSQSVKITSRCHNTEETWVKSFHKGKEQKLTRTLQRPSKGTTVDIKGFLYNLKIQKKAIDSLTEINDIKTFLEQLSLVHNNISLSLRDDTKNEIIFQLHKNRDIYQTLTSMFRIDKKDVQELKVEKNLYKISVFIGKRDDKTSQKHWIYLNGKFLLNSKIQKIVNDNLIKVLKLNAQNTRKVKSKNPYNQEENLSKSGIPFYFIFVTCPYYDYDISYASKQTVVEFKNWEHINKLIEKMAKFYAGEVNLKELKPIKNKVNNHNLRNDTRDQVKKIMDKILGSNPKKIGVSQMQNGIKGKITKRKPKKKVDKISLLKALPIPTDGINKTNRNNNPDLIKDKQPLSSNKLRENPKEAKTTKTVHNNFKKPKQKNKENVLIKDQHKNDKIIHNQKNKNNDGSNVHRTIKKKHKLTSPIVNDNSNKHSLDRNINVRVPTKLVKKDHKSKTKKIVTKSDRKIKSNPLIKIFKDPTSSVKKRCNLLANKVDNLICNKNKRKRKIFINETVQYSNIIKDNKNYSVRKKIGEIVIHDYIPKPIGLSPSASNDRSLDNTSNRPNKSSYDLIRTILRTQEITNSYLDKVNVDDNRMNVSPDVLINDISTQPFNKVHKPTFTKLDDDTPNIPILPRLTYESHNYVQNYNLVSHNYNEECYDCTIPKEKSVNMRFITTQSRDNFAIPTIKRKPRKECISEIKHTKFQSNKIHTFTKKNGSHEASSYTIEFSESNEKTPIEPDLVETQNENGTYSIEQNNEFGKDIYSQNNFTYTVSHNSMDNNIENEEKRYSDAIQNTDYIEDSNEKSPRNQRYWNDILTENAKFTSIDKISQQHNIMNVVFISKSQERKSYQNNGIETSQNTQVDPLNICETVHSQDVEEHENFRRQWNDSLFNDDFDVDSFLCNRNAYSQRNFSESIDADKINIFDEASLSFDARKETDNNDIIVTKDNERLNTTCDLQKDTEHKLDHSTNNGMESNNMTVTGYKHDINNERNHFNFKNRLRFVPKGMSQIFTKCHTKNACDYNLERDYYEEEIYNNFTNKVQFNCEILEPRVQSVKEFTTEAIHKVNNRLDKDNASLIFTGEALKKAKILRQIDNKFIAAKIEGRANQSLEMVEYLVLFDQHAVHERIRLESNMSDYYNGNEWKSMPLDSITLKLSKKETLYLHNFFDKFTQLGLQWTILTDGEVAINAIPEAILGKNPRQTEIVMKAVKNLIVEEINAIKSQSGCISMYPKSIMDLVFSEACRYAIKFGDPLSKSECGDLLNSLSECKTPFQCAHGRPVMAVLMDIKKDVKNYKINATSVQKWIKKIKVTNK